MLRFLGKNLITKDGVDLPMNILRSDITYLIASVAFSAINFENGLYQQHLSSMNKLATALYFIIAFVYAYANGRTQTINFLKKVAFFWGSVVSVGLLVNILPFLIVLFIPCWLFVLPAYALYYYIPGPVGQLVVVSFLMATLMVGGFFAGKQISKN